MIHHVLSHPMRRAFWVMGFASLVPLAVWAQVILPRGQGPVDGNASTQIPFGCAGMGESIRLQQVYLASEVGRGEIVEIRFRQDGDTAAPFPPQTLPWVELTLSSTPGQPDGLSRRFQDNVGADRRQVYSGPLTLWSDATETPPAPFDVVMTLTEPFVFAPSGSENLLLEMVLETCGSLPSLDATFVPRDGISRIFALDAEATVATHLQTAGLVTEVVFGRVAPAAARQVDGNTSTALPFGCLDGASGARMQQVFRGNAVGDGLITALELRADRPANVPARLVRGVEIRLSTTRAEPDALDPSFAANAGSDEQVVFEGDLIFTSDDAPVVPMPFATTIMLQRPFALSGSESNHLLLDILVPGCGDLEFFDAEHVLGDETSMIYAEAATASTAKAALSMGLVIRFLKAPARLVNGL